METSKKTCDNCGERYCLSGYDDRGRPTFPDILVAVLARRRNVVAIDGGQRGASWPCQRGGWRVSSMRRSRWEWSRLLTCGTVCGDGRGCWSDAEPGPGQKGARKTRRGWRQLYSFNEESSREQCEQSMVMLVDKRCDIHDKAAMGRQSLHVILRITHSANALNSLQITLYAPLNALKTRGHRPDHCPCRPASLAGRRSRRLFQSGGRSARPASLPKSQTNSPLRA